MSVFTAVYNTRMTPLRRVKFIPIVNDDIDGESFMVDNMVLVENGDQLSVSLRPDIMRVPTRSMARFMGLYDISEKVMNIKRDLLTLYFENDEDAITWLALLMSQTYRDSLVYQRWMSKIEAVDYLGWNPLMRESVYPVNLSKSDPTDIGIDSLLGEILLDGERKFPHHMDPYTTVSFPSAGKVIPEDVLNDIDSRYAHRVDDFGGIHVDIFGFSNPTSVSRVVRDILFSHIPEKIERNTYYYPDTYLNVRNTSISSFIPNWSGMDGDLMKPVDWENVKNNNMR